MGRFMRQHLAFPVAVLALVGITAPLSAVGLPSLDQLASDIDAWRLEAARKKADQMALVELQLGGILDGDDALLLGDERGEHVERGRLARARTAAEEDIEASLDTRLQEVEHLL